MLKYSYNIVGHLWLLHSCVFTAFISILLHNHLYYMKGLNTLNV